MLTASGDSSQRAIEQNDNKWAMHDAGIVDAGVYSDRSVDAVGYHHLHVPVDVVYG